MPFVIRAAASHVGRDDYDVIVTSQHWLQPQQMLSADGPSSGVDRGVGTGGPGPPSILRTRHKHTFKLHYICQFSQFILGKITEIVATRSYILVNSPGILCAAHNTASASVTVRPSVVTFGINGRRRKLARSLQRDGSRPPTHCAFPRSTVEREISGRTAKS